MTEKKAKKQSERAIAISKKVRDRTLKSMEEAEAEAKKENE